VRVASGVAVLPQAVPALVPLLPAVAHVGVVRLDEAIQRRRLGVTRPMKRAVGSSHDSARSRGVDGQAKSASTTGRPSRGAGAAEPELPDRGGPIASCTALPVEARNARPRQE